VKHFISTLLLIPICSLPVGTAYSADATRNAAISRHDATMTTPVRGLLDLRPPDMRNTPWMDSVLASVPADSDEPQAAAVVIAVAPLEETANTNLSIGGIGSLYWAARHPTRAWTMLLPTSAGDEFGAYADIRANCAVFLSAPASRTVCP
jgi:hypothetical protein